MKNNNLKKLAALMALLLCAAAMMLVMTGCDKGSDEITDIYITKADMPQVKYVEGQELDLSDGRLTVVTGSGESKVALTDSRVTVTGYDKTKLGDQTLTVQYAGLTTSITVNVKMRMVASNFETNYFVGDSFNKRIGKLQITTDDMKTISVNMSDEKVSVVSFDSSKAGMSTVTVSYTDGGATYNCQFSVTVYEEANVEFSAPYKTQYNSYDTGVDVSGGYFTVTSSDSKLTKQVPLTEEMVKSFDLSAATMEHRETPKTQTVIVEYLGREFTYDIQITFRGISVVNYHATHALGAINWADAKVNGLSKDASLAAIDAIKEYYNLSGEQLKMVSAEVKSTVSRAGAIAVATAFYEELKNYSNTIAMDASGNLYFLQPTYDQVKQDLAKLSDPEETINVYAGLLRNILEEFGAEMLDDEVAISNLITVYSKDTEVRMVEMLTHMIYIHELTMDIPKDWDADSLKEHGEDLLRAVMEIYNAGYYKSGAGGFYTNIVAPWREKADLFEIIYTYFVYDYENGQEFMANYMWGSVPMPGVLGDWYAVVSNAAGYANNFAVNGGGSAYLTETSAFMYYYFLGQELSEQIKNSGDQLLIDIYNIFRCDDIFYNYAYSYNGAYLHLARGMVDSAAFTAAWEAYYQVMKLAVTDNLSSAANAAELKAMFNAFQQLEPVELMGFLASLNYGYNTAGGALPVLSYDEETAYNMFTAILRDFYLDYLSENNKELFATLLQAMENFALMGQKSNASEQFNALMKRLSASYNQLSDADRENFDTYAGVAYQRYLRLYQLSSGTTTITLSKEEEALFNELHQVLTQYFDGYVKIMAIVQEQQGATVDWYTVIFSLHSRASELYNQIMECSQMAKDALYLLGYDLADGQSSLAQGFYIAEDLSLSLMEGSFINMTDAYGYQQQIAYWDVYTKHGMAPFMADIAQMLYKAYFTEDPAMDQEFLVNIMEQMRQLTAMERSGLMAMGVEEAFYKALHTAMSGQLSQSAVDSSFLQYLLTAERIHLNCLLAPENEDARTAFMTQMELVVETYASLNENDRAYLDGIYNYYLEIYQQMQAAA